MDAKKWYFLNKFEKRLFCMKPYIARLWRDLTKFKKV
jgi:hypothetical protein